MTNLGISTDDPELRGILKDREKSLYYRFRQRAWQLHDPAERSPWGVVFSMQHHGIPTRLMDWTESFLCALFFAQKDRTPGEEAAIFVMDPDGLNEAALGVPGIVALDDEQTDRRIRTERYHPTAVLSDGPLPPLAVAPLFTNARMAAQRSAFLLCGHGFLPLDEQATVFTRLTLCPQTFEDAVKYLEAAGISNFTYFPDLQGLTDDLMAEWSNEVKLALANKGTTVGE